MRRTSLVALLASLFVAAAAHAEPTVQERATAQSLFDQARASMAKNDFAKACSMLEESQRIDPAEGTKFHLAKCYEGAGRVASAWLLYGEIADDEKAAKHAERERVARGHADGIAAKVPRLRIDVPSAPDDLEVKRDGRVVGKGQWGVPLPIDPGDHDLVATSKGAAVWSQKVTLHEGETLPVKVTPSSAPIAAPPPATAAPVTSSPSSSPPEPAKGSWSTQRTLALVSGGVGVVGVALGAVFGLSAKSKHDTVTSHCGFTDGGCDQTGVDAHDDQVKAGNLSTIFFVIGGVGLAGGATLWLTAPSGDASNGTALRLTPMTTGRASMLSLSGGF